MSKKVLLSLSQKSLDFLEEIRKRYRPHTLDHAADVAIAHAASTLLSEDQEEPTEDNTAPDEPEEAVGDQAENEEPEGE